MDKLYLAGIKSKSYGSHLRSENRCLPVGCGCTPVLGFKAKQRGYSITRSLIISVYNRQERDMKNSLETSGRNMICLQKSTCLAAQPY